MKNIGDKLISRRLNLYFEGEAGICYLFLGGLGIHKFYLGKPFQGIIYLLFAWTFISAIVAFVEGIIYLTMDDRKFVEKYGE